MTKAPDRLGGGLVARWPAHLLRRLPAAGTCLSAARRLRQRGRLSRTLCRTPDWADLDEQAAELYRWGWQEGRDGKAAREKLSAYDKPQPAATEATERDCLVARHGIRACPTTDRCATCDRAPTKEQP